MTDRSLFRLRSGRTIILIAASALGLAGCKTTEDAVIASTESVADVTAVGPSENEPDCIESKDASGVIVKSSGPSAACYPVGAKAGRIVLKEGDSVTLIVEGRTQVFRGPGVFEPGSLARTNRSANLFKRSTGRVRAGAVGGGAPLPPQPMMQVVRGDVNSLAWYRVGRRVAVGARICLPDNARFITFERLDGGGQITYGGGGCNIETAAPPKGADEADGVWRGP